MPLYINMSGNWKTRNCVETRRPLGEVFSNFREITSMDPRQKILRIYIELCKHNS